MTRTISRKFTSRIASTPKVEDMLRDIAYVLHLTKKVKASMIADASMPSGGRFSNEDQKEEEIPMMDLAMA